MLVNGLVHKFIHNINKWLGSNYTPINEELAENLYQRFEPENNRLERLLTRDLSFWNKRK